MSSMGIGYGRSHTLYPHPSGCRSSIGTNSDYDGKCTDGLGCSEWVDWMAGGPSERVQTGVGPSEGLGSRGLEVLGSRGG